MIDRNRLRRVCLGALGLLVLSLIVALAGWRSPALAGGLALGFALGALPFASWAWVLRSGGRGRLLAVLLLVVKMALYAGALYLLVTREIVNPVGVMIGLTEVVFLVPIAVLLSPAPAKEAA